MTRRYDNVTYLRYNPFDADRDVDVSVRTVKMVTTRKTQKCMDPFAGRLHDIPAGTFARYETALADGVWGRYYVCSECMDKWLEKACGLMPLPVTD